MTPESLKNRRLIGVFLFGFVLFNYPILSLFNLKRYVFGIPLLSIYIFGVWLLLILMIVFITKTGGSSGSSRKPIPPVDSGSRHAAE